MQTYIYFVRHSESPFIIGEERSRGLSEKGKLEALKVTTILEKEEIGIYVSSPYERAIQTIKDAAGNKEILIFEDLRERQIGIIPDNKFKESKLMAYQDFDYYFPGGESSKDAQQRAIKILIDLLNTFEGKKIVIGTHGDVMTLMMNYFDKSYNYEFWESTTMPDIYKLQFEGINLINVTRQWNIRGRQWHQLTPYSRFGPFGPRSGPELKWIRSERISDTGKRNQPDTSNSLTASRPSFGLKGVGRREYKNIMRNTLSANSKNGVDCFEYRISYFNRITSPQRSNR